MTGAEVFAICVVLGLIALAVSRAPRSRRRPAACAAGAGWVVPCPIPAGSWVSPANFDYVGRPRPSRGRASPPERRPEPAPPRKPPVYPK